MPRLKNTKPSGNFEDRTVPGLSDQFHNMMFRLLYPIAKAISPGNGFNQISPEANDAYVRRAQTYSDENWKTFNDEEKKLIQDNGFSMDDIQVMRDYRKAQRTGGFAAKKKFRVEEDGSVSRK